jgi:hypothetical protein
MKQFGIFLVWLLLLLVSCKSAGPTGPTSEPSILFNSSFEADGKPSLDGWIVHDSTSASSSNDVPPSGGIVSLCLQDANFGNDAIAQIPLPSGFHIYRLSIWAKKTSTSGRFDVGFLPAQRQILPWDFAIISDTSWREYSLTDTLTTKIGDSLKIFLSPGYAEVILGRTYFDLCKMEQLQ